MQVNISKDLFLEMVKEHPCLIGQNKDVFTAQFIESNASNLNLFKLLNSNFEDPEVLEYLYNISLDSNQISKFRYPYLNTYNIRTRAIDAWSSNPNLINLHLSFFEKNIKYIPISYLFSNCNFSKDYNKTTKILSLFVNYLGYLGNILPSIKIYIIYNKFVDQQKISDIIEKIELLK